MVAELEQIPTPRLLVGDVLAKLRTLPANSCDLVVSSPPYNLQKEYERDERRSLREYGAWQSKVVKALSRVLRDGASVCWQVGTYVSDGEVFPLDELFLPIFRNNGFKLRNRIVWRYNFGLNATQRFSGRYETVLWLTKGDGYTFNLDPVRVPQLYPGKRHGPKKGLKAGQPSGNPLGKNPSDFWEFSPGTDFMDADVWDIPNVKSRHPERTSHPCQFPVELAERCVLALSNPGDTVLDPFIGTGTTAIAAMKWGRFAVGIDRDSEYVEVARGRLKALADGTLITRQLGTPIRQPSAREGVARVPEEWLETKSSAVGVERGEEGQEEAKEAVS